MPRILIIKTSSMGDVVHNLPLITDISRNVPDAHIDWVVEEAFAEIPALHPAVRSVIQVALRRWRKSPFRPAIWREIGAFRQQVRAQRYDLVLDSQGLLKSALLARQAKAPVWGLDHRSAREPLAARFYRHRIAVPKAQHAVQRNRALGARVFGYALPADPPDYGINAAPIAHALDLPACYVVCLHATSRDSKLWPEDRWIALAARLHQAGIAAVLPWGSPSERARAERLAANMAHAVVLPRLGLGALAQVLAKAHAVIGVDTGLVHLAAALSRPTIALYTDTNPALTGVLGPDPQRARNLGRQGVTPSVAEVLAVLASMNLRAPC